MGEPWPRQLVTIDIRRKNPWPTRVCGLLWARPFLDWHGLLPSKILSVEWFEAARWQVSSPTGGGHCARIFHAASVDSRASTARIHQPVRRRTRSGIDTEQGIVAGSKGAGGIGFRTVRPVSAGCLPCAPRPGGSANSSCWSRRGGNRPASTHRSAGGRGMPRRSAC